MSIGPSPTRRQLLRWGLVGAAAAALPGALTGCATQTAAAVRSGDVTLDLWTHDDGYITFFTDSVPVVQSGSRFRYELDVTKIGSADLVTKVLAQAVAGTGTPDVAGFEIGNFARLLRGNITEELLVDLSDVRDRLGDDLIQARVAPFSKDGRLYALDSDAPLVVQYYREDLFREDGLSLETPETWAEFLDAAEAVSSRKGTRYGAVGVGSDLGQVLQGFQIPLMQAGGNLFDAEGRLTIETPEAERALAFLVDGIQRGVFTTVTDMYGGSIQAALKSGELAAVSMPSWYASYGIQPNVPEQAGRWRIRPLPRMTEGGSRTSVGGGTGFAALRAKPNSEAAAELVEKVYLSPAQQVARYKALGYLPTLRSVYDDPELLALGNDYFGGQPLFEVYAEIVDEIPPYYQSPDMSILQTVLSGALLDAYRGRRTPAEALSTAADAFRGQTRSER
ncbi:extracellular solute-binding protein [Puerhibacterium puerhi]|uniref:extracellular solute-binding protein n=1 Tax=Puerhibacterium puerhi TaxID=2692623 RepID=UPI00135ABB60|nr:extracellular solute-binding protein [Puerhibacterium puerhi]